MSRLPMVDTHWQKGWTKGTVEWNGKTTPHLCSMKKENTDWREKRKRNRFQSPHSTWRQEVRRKSFWQGVLVGFDSSECGAEDRGVCSRGSRMHVCTVYALPWVYKCVCARVDRGCWGKASCSRGGRHPAVCQSAGWKMTAIWIESKQHNSQRGRGWRAKCQGLH